MPTRFRFASASDGTAPLEVQDILLQDDTNANIYVLRPDGTTDNFNNFVFEVRLFENARFLAGIWQGNDSVIRAAVFDLGTGALASGDVLDAPNNIFLLPSGPPVQLQEGAVQPGGSIVGVRFLGGVFQWVENTIVGIINTVFLYQMVLGVPVLVAQTAAPDDGSADSFGFVDFFDVAGDNFFGQFTTAAFTDTFAAVMAFTGFDPPVQSQGSGSDAELQRTNVSDTTVGTLYEDNSGSHRVLSQDFPALSPIEDAALPAVDAPAFINSFISLSNTLGNFVMKEDGSENFTMAQLSGSRTGTLTPGADIALFPTGTPTIIPLFAFASFLQPYNATDFTSWLPASPPAGSGRMLTSLGAGM
jgi:hypothetical protein